jgi:hypothetical protein
MIRAQLHERWFSITDGETKVVVARVLFADDYEYSEACKRELERFSPMARFPGDWETQNPLDWNW